MYVHIYSLVIENKIEILNGFYNNLKTSTK